MLPFLGANQAGDGPRRSRGGRSGSAVCLVNHAVSGHQDERGESAWPQVIGTHVAVVVRALHGPSPFQTMRHEEILAATYLRVIAAEDVLP